MTNVKTRPAIARDLSQIEALVQAAYGPWVDRIGATPGPMLDDYGAVIADGVMQVVEDADGIVAMLVLRPKDEFLLLENVAVHPRAQGHGLGRGLIEVAEAAARDHGVTCVILYTHARMASNIALYERAGFEVVEERHEHGLDRVYMKKVLR